MTWGGMIYNMFSNDPIVHDTRGQKKESVAGNPPNNPAVTAAATTLPNGGGNSTFIDSNGVRDEDIDKLLHAVTGLHDMSLTMAAHLEGQNEMLDRIEEKATRVDEQTLAVTLRTSQLIQSSSIKRTEGYVGLFQFIEPTGTCSRFLSVNSDLLTTLVEREDRSTLFEIYKRGDNLYGIKNSKTLTYLGTTIWGLVRAGSATFGKREECHINLDVTETGIFFLAANWGAGGWLKTTPTVSKAKNGVNDEEHNKTLEYSSLQSMTSCVTDKIDWLVLRPIAVNEPNETDRNSF